MEEKMLKVNIEGNEYEFPRGTAYREIVQQICTENPRQVILVEVNGKLCELSKMLQKDSEIKLIRTTEPDGFKTFERTAVFVMLKAMFDICGKKNTEKVVLHYSIANGLYFTVTGAELTEELLQKVKTRMQEITEKDIPIIKRNIPIDEAVALFHRHHMYDKEKLFRYRRSSWVNIYSIENFDDYYYGYMAPSAGWVDIFDLKLFDEGFVLLLPERKMPGILPEFSPQTKLKVFEVQKESQEWGERMHVATVGDLNERFTMEGVQNILLTQEALHEAKIASIASEILSRDNVRFVMIAGPSSSGKTSFSHRLSIQLMAQGLTPHPIELDNYFVNREDTPIDEFGEKDYECLEALDIKQFNEDMLQLLEGKRVQLPTFNFVSGQREYKGNSLKLEKGEILVIEGIHGLNDRLSYALPVESKFKIYISPLTQLSIDEHNRIPATDGRLIRRIVRDARTRGITAQETLHRWPSVRRGEVKNIYPYQNQADMIFNSSLVYELACLKVYAEPLLFGIAPGTPEYIEANRLLKFFDYFVPVPGSDVPNNSLLREFIGGSIFRV